MDYELQVVIAEDQPAIAEYLGYLVEKVNGFRVTGTADTGISLIEQVRLCKPDVVFVDIDLPQISGLDAVKQIQQEGFNPLVVFVTAHYEHALEAFDLTAFDYLTKPVDEERMNKTLRKISERFSNERKYIQAINEVFAGPEKIVIKIGHNICFIKQQEIIMITRQGKKTKIITKAQVYETNEVMQEVERKLTVSYLMRSHKSYIINLYKIQQISTLGQGAYAVKLEDTKEEAFITRDKVHLIFKALKIPFKDEE